MEVPAAATTQSGSTPHFLRDGTLQGSVSIAAVAIDLQLFDGHGQFAQRKRCHAAGREIESRGALGFSPQHVIGMSLSHKFGFGVQFSLLLGAAPVQIYRDAGQQNNQADGGVRRKSRDRRDHDGGAGQHEESGGVRMAGRQDTASAAESARLRRNTNSDAAVKPKEMKSTEIT